MPAKSGFYPTTFVYSHFPPKIQFLYCFLTLVAPWGGPMEDTKEKILGNLGMQHAEKCIFLGFFLEF